MAHNWNLLCSLTYGGNPFLPTIWRTKECGSNLLFLTSAGLFWAPTATVLAAAGGSVEVTRTIIYWNDANGFTDLIHFNFRDLTGPFNTPIAVTTVLYAMDIYQGSVFAVVDHNWTFRSDDDGVTFNPIPWNVAVGGTDRYIPGRWIKVVNDVIYRGWSHPSGDCGVSRFPVGGGIDEWGWSVPGLSNRVHGGFLSPSGQWRFFFSLGQYYDTSTFNDGVVTATGSLGTGLFSPATPSELIELSDTEPRISYWVSHLFSDDGVVNASIPTYPYSILAADQYDPLGMVLAGGTHMYYSADGGLNFVEDGSFHDKDNGTTFQPQPLILFSLHDKTVYTTAINRRASDANLIFISDYSGIKNLTVTWTGEGFAETDVTSLLPGEIANLKATETEAKSPFLRWEFDLETGTDTTSIESSLAYTMPNSDVIATAVFEVPAYMTIRWCDNGTQWSKERHIGLGRTGEMNPFARLAPMGIFRTRQFEIVLDQPNPQCVVYIEAEDEVLGA